MELDFRSAAVDILMMIIIIINKYHEMTLKKLKHCSLQQNTVFKLKLEVKIQT